MAHRRVDVKALNDAIRAELQDRGELARGEEAGALTFQTLDGKREFAPGIGSSSWRNNRDLGVKNGMLGTVEGVAAGRIVVKIDGRGGEGLSVPTDDYTALDHGYATTIHKNQGATVDRAYVLASNTMDRHLTYVAMTRHRHEVHLYAALDEFSRADGWSSTGRLRSSTRRAIAPATSWPWRTTEASGGRFGASTSRGRWPSRAEDRRQDRPPPGGAASVTLPDGTPAHRNTWKVQTGGALAYGELERRLSRSGVKETTLDYIRGFAERRGIAERLGIRSEIEIPCERQRAGAGVPVIGGTTKRPIIRRALPMDRASATIAPTREVPSKAPPPIGEEREARAPAEVEPERPAWRRPVSKRRRSCRSSPSSAPRPRRREGLVSERRTPSGDAGTRPTERRSSVL